MNQICCHLTLSVAPFHEAADTIAQLTLTKACPCCSSKPILVLSRGWIAGIRGLGEDPAYGNSEPWLGAMEGARHTQSAIVPRCLLKCSIRLDLVRQSKSNDACKLHRTTGYISQSVANKHARNVQGRAYLGT